jgi:3-oxoacyl-[acyl-carrier protein] reductase
MLLENKNAVIYGAGGPIGSAVASAFAREGARVHLAGRTAQRLDALAETIRADGGAAETAQLDALDEAAVDRHADAVAEQFGSLDVSLCVIAADEVFFTPLAEMALADFERPVTTLLRSAFITARAAARHMVRQRSGVILSFGGSGAPLRDFYLGGFQVGLAAVEILCRQLAAELGPHGVRVVTLQTSGIVDAIPDDTAGRRGDRREHRQQDDARPRRHARRRRQRRRVRCIRSRPVDHRHRDQHHVWHRSAVIGVPDATGKHIPTGRPTTVTST